MISKESVKFVGSSLSRPESVVANNDGDLIISNYGGGYAKILLGENKTQFVIPNNKRSSSIPNGILINKADSSSNIFLHPYKRYGHTSAHSDALLITIKT